MRLCLHPPSLASPLARAPRMASALMASALMASACGAPEALVDGSGEAVVGRRPASSTPPAGTFSIASVATNGNGCRPGTVASSLAEDGGEFTLIFSELFASAGPGVSPSESRRTCRVTIDLDAPDGYAFALSSVEARGYLQLDEGVAASLTLTRFSIGGGRPESSTTEFQGPTDEDYLVTRSEPGEQLAWSRCRRRGRDAVRLESSVRVGNERNPSGIGLITTDSLDGTVSEVHHILWRRCAR